MYHRAGSGEGWGDGCRQARVEECVGFRLFVKVCLWLGLVLLVLSSCETDSNGSVGLPDEPPTRSVPLYLEETIPPCIPFWDSDHNPCLPGKPSEVETVSVHADIMRRSPFPTWVDILLDDEDAIYPIHLVIRGEALFGTTRCEYYRAKLGNHLYERWGSELAKNIENALYIEYYCFTDIGVKEYIIGSGPPILTVAMHVENIIYDIDNPQPRVSVAYEGKEMVLLLGPTFTVTVESWQARAPLAGVWFVQKFGDHIRAVAPDLNWVNEEDHSKLDMPLDDLTKQIKKAGEERTSLTDGRIGVESYFPLLVTDANFLQNFYISEGAVYDDSEDATVLPPPVPGEGDPCSSYYPDQLSWGWLRSSLPLCPTLRQR